MAVSLALLVGWVWCAVDCASVVLDTDAAINVLSSIKYYKCKKLDSLKRCVRTTLVKSHN